MRASKEARTLKRWREQVARLIANCDDSLDGLLPASEVERLRLARSNRLLDGSGQFNVAKVRSYAESLIAEGRLRLGQPQRCQGGWPGSLAREWGTVRCEACELRGRKFSRECTACDGAGFHDDPVDPLCLNCRGTGRLYERCKPCKGRGYVKHPKREAAAANGGAWMIRAGRRLLDTLEGKCPWAPSAAAQSSECEPCHGRGWYYLNDGTEGLRRPKFDDSRERDGSRCPKCRGTGHNLSGTLPPVEWSAHVRWKHNDSHEADPDNPGTERWSWVDDLVDIPMLGFQRTRVAPRGQHRAGSDDEPFGAITGVRANVASHGYKVGDMVRVRGYGVGRWAPRSTDDHKRRASGWQPEELMPRWRRGELRHSEQRRERERSQQENRPIGTVREALADGTVPEDLDN